MAAVDLGFGLSYMWIHDNVERISLSRPFSTVMELGDGYGGEISRALLLLSMRTSRSIYRSQLRISINGFNISRVAKPASELFFKNQYHSIFIYDLMPIRDRISGRAELEIESRDLEILVDGIAIIATYSIDSLREARCFNTLHTGPYILSGGEKIHIKARRQKGGEMIFRAVALPHRRANITLSLEQSRFEKTFSVDGISEIFVRYIEPDSDGDEDIVISLRCVEGECLAKIPWILVTSTSIKGPNYILKEAFLSDSMRELIIEFENTGDLDAGELCAIALWRGSIVGRTIARPSKRGRIAVPLNMRIPPDSLRNTGQNKLTARITWNWLGRTEETSTPQ